jgi:pimeloyl-ACP methyl ester carboxylesterase
MLRGDEASFRQVMDLLLESLRGELDADEWERLAALRRVDQDVVLAIWSTVLDTEADELTAMVEALASSITVPYLSLHGSDPGEGYEEWLRGLVVDSLFEEWVGTGHYPHLVQPARFLELLDEFETSISDD